MTETPETASCQNCRDLHAVSELDRFGWCERCRRVVVGRATLAARLIAGLTLAGLAYWVMAVLDPNPRFLIAWLLLVLVVYAVVYKVTQRVAFEMFRSRGVPPPER